MTEFEKDEFWKALGRLYDNAIQLTKATEALRDVAQAHEKRLDRSEVIVEWLAEEQRRRDKRDTV